jgi:hypothetical protein
VDKVPPEVQFRIFKEVLRCDYSLIPANKKFSAEVRFNTALLSTCKTVYQEASHALFEANTLVLWEPKELRKGVRTDAQWMHFVRHLEPVNLLEDCWLPDDMTQLQRLVGPCLAMPKLRSLTIACDAERETMLQYLELMLLDHDFACVDVGVFKLKPNTNSARTLIPASKLSLAGKECPEVFYKHYGMTKAWKTVQGAGKGDVGLPTIFTAYCQQHGISEFPDRAAWGLVGACFVRDCELPVWCRLIDILRRVQPFPTGIVPPPIDMYLVANFVSRWYDMDAHYIYRVEKLERQLDLTIDVKDLSVAEHGEETVRHSCDMLVHSAYGHGAFENVLKL